MNILPIKYDNIITIKQSDDIGDKKVIKNQ